MRGSRIDFVDPAGALLGRMQTPEWYSDRPGHIAMRSARHCAAVAFGRIARYQLWNAAGEMVLDGRAEDVFGNCGARPGQSIDLQNFSLTMGNDDFNRGIRLNDRLRHLQILEMGLLEGRMENHFSILRDARLLVDCES